MPKWTHQNIARMLIEPQQVEDLLWLKRLMKLHHFLMPETPAEKQVIENERDQFLARVEGDRGRLQQLGADGVGSMTRIIEEVTEQRNHLERKLNEAHTALSAAEDRIEMLNVRANKINSIFAP